MNSPRNDAKAGASTLAACGYAPVQWKIALGWMRDANMAASGSGPNWLLTAPATRKLAEYLCQINKHRRAICDAQPVRWTG
jgi:hypothetical protein